MNNVKQIIINRTEYSKNSTIGNVFVDGRFFSYSLEDTVRPIGIKVKSHTAIPTGDYEVIISFSNRFKRNTIQLYNSIDKSVSDKICTWTGIRIHGGNTHEDTEGCPLVAYRKIDSDTIQKRADLDLLEIVEDWIKDGYTVKCKIINENQE